MADQNALRKRLMKTDKASALHSSGYGQAQSGERMGATSSESFSRRIEIEQQRKMVMGYRNARIMNGAYGVERARKYIPRTGNQAADGAGSGNASGAQSGNYAGGGSGDTASYGGFRAADSHSGFRGAGAPNGSNAPGTAGIKSATDAAMARAKIGARQGAGGLRGGVKF